MSYFAKVNFKNNATVEDVIIAEKEFIDTLPVEEGVLWIKTSFNTLGGAHKTGGTPLRKNFAGIGYRYDATRDAFYVPQPFASWTLDEDTCYWNPPVAYPSDGKFYDWDENTTEWKENE